MPVHVGVGVHRWTVTCHASAPTLPGDKAGGGGRSPTVTRRSGPGAEGMERSGFVGLGRAEEKGGVLPVHNARKAKPVSPIAMLCYCAVQQSLDSMKASLKKT